MLFPGERDKAVGCVGYVPYPRAGHVEVDDGARSPVREDEVVGCEVVVADHLAGTERGLELPNRAIQGNVPYGRIVVATQEACSSASSDHAAGGSG